MIGRIKLLTIIAAVIIISVVLSVSVKAYANDKKGREYREAVERSEAEYVKDVREYLNDYGFKNAGVNLTKEYDENRNVTYKLVVNHHSFEYASDAKIHNMENCFYEKADEYLCGNLKTEFSF
ncbi:MAG: hypothetical protein IKS56_01710 [Lachnospiraceae bacterium]|nr:hypothetical protein [Lachnospiraceae bacterium]